MHSKKVSTPLTLLVVQQLIGKDVPPLDAQLVSDRENGDLEAARHQVHGHAAPVQQIDQLLDARRERAALAVAVELVQVGAARPDDVEADGERLSEGHVAAHGLLGQPLHLLDYGESNTFRNVTSRESR